MVDTPLVSIPRYFLYISISGVAKICFLHKTFGQEHKIKKENIWHNFTVRFLYIEDVIELRSKE